MEGSVLLLGLEEFAGEFATIVGTPRNDGERFTTTKSSHCSYKRCRISQSADRKNNDEEDKAEVVVRREGNCNKIAHEVVEKEPPHCKSKSKSTYAILPRNDGKHTCTL